MAELAPSFLFHANYGVILNMGVLASVLWLQ
jgi:hypothetical protein